MRWFFRLSLGLVLVWAAYAASPFVALYRLSQAVEARDVAAVSERVNFQALRLSLAKQIASGYLVATGKVSAADSASGRMATGIGATVADPILAELLTPERLIELLNTGRVEETAPGVPALPAEVGGIGFPDFGQAWRFFVASEARGFRRYYFPLPPDKPEAEQFTLELRLYPAAFTWRVTGLELPTSIRQRLVDELMRRTTG